MPTPALDPPEERGVYVRVTDEGNFLKTGPVPWSISSDFIWDKKLFIIYNIGQTCLLTTSLTS